MQWQQTEGNEPAGSRIQHRVRGILTGMEMAPKGPMESCVVMVWDGWKYKRARLLAKMGCVSCVGLDG